MLSALRSPVALVLVTGLLALLVLVVGTGELGGRAARTEAVADARSTTELLARSVVAPALPRGLVAADPGAVDRLDRVVARLAVPGVRRVKIWSAEGRIVYSDDTRLIGESFPLGRDEREVLSDGGSDAEVSDLSRPENRFERGAGELLEVYTRVRSPEGTPLLFEMYFSADAVAARQQQVLAQFRPITLSALGAFVVVATGLLWLLTRRLRRSALVRERLLRSAVQASDAERLRIARDLHDGVVQDLAGASFAVSAVARGQAIPGETRADLEAAGESLRRSLRGLRSLLVEIYPPDLHRQGLRGALEDLLAPAAATGLRVTASVEEPTGVSEHAVALAWRVAQEAVRNALRHSGAETLTVRVERTGPGRARVPGAGPDGAGLRLEVSDDGCGFDPDVNAAQGARNGHFGLRGMSSLIAEAGARLDVRSSPGDGTTIRLEIPGGAR